ncbi:unnamed protein product [Phytomonas sp. EM1]|nr:unnamed protein product [Phytomonas sp. EM1]|eukprot:CCW62313.1 unnamed protein product [Phytomonas sp. isolate EM1]
MLESRLFYSSKAMSTTREKRVPDSFSSRFTKSRRAAPSATLPSADSDKTDGVGKNRSNSARTATHNGDKQKIPLTSSDKPRGRYSSQHKAVNKTKSSVSPSRQRSSGLRVDGNRFTQHERKHEDRSAILAEKSDKNKSSSELHKLLCEHNNLRKNYAFQRSKTAYDSFCSLCLKVLSETDLLQRLCARPDMDENNDEGQSGDMEATKIRFPESEGNEVLLEVVAENSASCTLSVRLSAQAMQWLGRPITLPDIFSNELIHVLSETVIASVDTDDTHKKASYSSILQERWQQHWLQKNPKDFKRIFEYCFGLESFSSPHFIHTDVSNLTAEAPRASFSGEEASRSSLVKSDNIGGVFDLLRTITFFKWSKDDTLLASPQTKGLRTVQSHTSSHDKENKGCPEECDPPDSFLSSHIMVMRAALRSLRAYDKRMEVQNGEAAQADDARFLDCLEEHSNLVQQLRKHAQAVLDEIPKVDILPQPVFSPSSSPTSANLHLLTEEKGETKSECNHAALTKKIPVYRIHVIDVLFSILFRYMLLQWPFLTDAHQRGMLFRLGTFPWFAEDITQSMAMWYTFWETWSWTDASADSQTLFSSSQHATPRQRLRGRQHFSSDKNLTASSVLCAKGSFFMYMQYLRMICLPHVLDWRSATLRYVLGLSSSFNAVLNAEDGSSLSKVGSKGKSELRANCLPPLRDAASIFYSSENKQRLAYELIYLLINCLNSTLTTPSGNVNQKNPEVAERIARNHSSSASYLYRDSVSTLFVYVADMDHFISERFHENVMHQNKWVILFSQPPESSPDETNEKTSVSAAVQNLQQNLLAQSTQPYMLTRQLLQVVLPSAQPWPFIPAKGMKVVWKSIFGAVATPCYQSFASRKTVGDEEAADKATTATLETRETAWRLVYPLLNSLSGEWLQQLLWPRLINGLKELFPQISDSTGAGKVWEGEAGAQRRQTPTIGEAKGDDIILKDLNRLLQLGYFGGFLLMALREEKTTAAIEVAPSTTPASSSSPEGKYDEWAQTLRVEFTAAVHRLITQQLGKGVDFTHFSRPLLTGWLISSSDMGAIRTLLVNQDANSATSYSSLHRLFSTFIFSEELSNAVREWARKCESLAHHRAQLAHATDPVLTHWYTILHEDNIGLRPLKLSFLGLYRELWDFISTRQRAEDMANKNSNGKAILSNETDYASETPIEQGSTEAYCFPRLGIHELPIILRVASTMHSRLGLNSLKSFFGNFFTNLTGTIIRQLQRQHILQKQLDTEKHHGPGRSLFTQDAAALGSATSAPSINASVSTLQSRMFFIENSLKSNVQDQLSQLPLSAVLDAWYLGLISRSDIEGVLCGMCQNDADEMRGKKSEEGQTLTDGQHKSVGWIEDTSQFKQDLRSSKQVRLVAGLLLLREYPFTATGTSSGALNNHMKSTHKGTQAVMDDDTERRMGLTTLMQLVLHNLVELEYENCISGVESRLHDLHSTSQLTPAMGTSHILATTEAETAGGVSMVEYAQQVSRVHAIAAALFLQYGPDPSLRTEMPFCWPRQGSSSQGCELPSKKSSCQAGDLSCHREHVLELYALFLHAMHDAIPGLERGISEELLLYLVTSTYTVQLHYGYELQHLAQTHAERCNSANANARDRRLFTLYRSMASASFPLDETTKPQLPPSTPIFSVLSLVQQAVGQPSPEGSSYPPGILEALSITMEWGAYLVSQILPHTEKTLSQLKQKGNTPNVRALCTSTVAFCGLEAIGLTVEWWAKFPLEQLLQRVAIDRGEMQRHLNYFLITVMSHYRACTALVPAASYLRGGRDFMSLQMLIRTFKAILLASAALDPSQTTQNEELNQHREAEPRNEVLSSTPGVSIGEHYEADQSEESTVKGIIYDKRLYTLSSRLSPNYDSSPQLRSLWSGLVRCLFEHHTLTAPVEPFLLALHSGASVGCADTRDFEQLLAHVLFADGVAGQLPPLAALGLAEWAGILSACATSVWNRPAYTQVLCEPLLNFVILSTQEPFAALRDSSPYCVLRETPRRLDAATYSLQGSLEKIRQLCIELCHFLESVSALYVEGDKFWQAFRSMVDAWVEEIRACKPSDGAPQSSSAIVVMGNDEINFWIQEWTKSFNWSVKTAGHFGLVIASEDEANREGACVAELKGMVQSSDNS